MNVVRIVAPLLVVSGALLACAEDDAIEGTGGGTSGTSGTSTSGSSGTTGTSGGASGTSGTSGTTPPARPECAIDADCAAKDTDGDACTTQACVAGSCTQKLVRGTPECECHGESECYNRRGMCNTVECKAHRCVETIAPAGPAPHPRPGNCAREVCDGVAIDGSTPHDPTDIEDDKNPCTVDTCGPAFPEHNPVTNGTACGDGAVCLAGKCVPCKPANPAACGGADTNDTAATASRMDEYTPFCAFSNGTDVDWYTFQATDGAFSFDRFDFQFWSPAPTIEACIYVKCTNGAAPTGCGAMQTGPNGSSGCCWTGAPSTLNPAWDMRCADTGEDSGTAWVSIRTPGAGGCAPVVMTGGY